MTTGDLLMLRSLDVSLPYLCATGPLVVVFGRPVDGLPLAVLLRTETFIRLHRRGLRLAHEFVIAGQALWRQRS